MTADMAVCRCFRCCCRSHPGSSNGRARAGHQQQTRHLQMGVSRVFKGQWNGIRMQHSEWQQLAAAAVATMDWQLAKRGRREHEE